MVTRRLTMSVVQLVDRKKDRLQENLRVQDNLEKAKMARRPIIRYIQVSRGLSRVDLSTTR